MEDNGITLFFFNHFRVDYFGKYNQLENNYRESLNYVSMYAKDHIDK